MSNVTRNDVWELAKSRSNDLVKLASDLIRIPSENPVGTQRDVIDFVEKYLSDAGISYEEVSCNPDHPNVLAKMGKNEYVSMESLHRICQTLSCDIGEIVEFIDE